MTNEYFLRCGISRQVLRKRVIKGEIKPILKNGGISLYPQVKADSLILDFWIDNYKRFLKLIEKEWETKKSEGHDLGDHSNMVEEIYDRERFITEIPPIFEFRKVVEKYYDFKTFKSRDPNNSNHVSFSNRYHEGIMLRNNRFKESKLSVDEFIKEESMNKFLKRTHRQIQQDYQIRQMYRDKNLPGLYNCIQDLKKMVQQISPEYEHNIKTAKLHYKKLKNLMNKGEK